jgi:hypothetical protein
METVEIETQTGFELNLAVLKIKQTVKRTNSRKLNKTLLIMKKNFILFAALQYTIDIYDMLGNRISQHLSNGEHTSIPAPEHAGVYIVSIRCNEGLTQEFRIVGE